MLDPLLLLIPATAIAYIMVNMEPFPDMYKCRAFSVEECLSYEVRLGLANYLTVRVVFTERLGHHHFHGYLRITLPKKRHAACGNINTV